MDDDSFFMDILGEIDNIKRKAVEEYKVMLMGKIKEKQDEFLLNDDDDLLGWMLSVLEGK